MYRKLYWGLGVFLVLFLVYFVFMMVKNQSENRELMDQLAEMEKLTDQIKEREASKNNPPVARDGYKMVPHGDHWHEVPIDAPDVEHDDEPEVKYTAPHGAVLEPVFPTIDPEEDPVKAAYKRLEYIKNNPFAWGGVHSLRATELISQLMPPPVLIDHAHSEQVSSLMTELIEQNDPRAAEVLITNMCEGSIGGKFMFDGLVAIGPPAVPYILPYLKKVVTYEGSVSPEVFRILAIIAARHQDDLGDIVEHILIPNLITIAADEQLLHYDPPLLHEAQAALEQLKE